MICLNPITKSPTLAALFAGCLVLIYLAMMTYSANLPPAVLCSVLVALCVYTMMGGKLTCPETPYHQTEVPEGISSIATGHQDVEQPFGESVNTFKLF